MEVEEDMDVEMDIGSEDEGEGQHAEPAPAPLMPDKVIVRKDYNPKGVLVCLLCLCAAVPFHASVSTRVLS